MIQIYSIFMILYDTDIFHINNMIQIYSICMILQDADIFNIHDTA